MNLKFAWIANGQLYLKSLEGDEAEWTSAFAAQVQANTDSIQRRHAWKSQGRGARFAAWGAAMPEDMPSTITPAVMTALTLGRKPDEVLYVVQTPTVSAILGREDGDAPVELRLFHTADFHITDLSADMEREKIAVSVSHPSGVVNIGILNKQGSHCRDVTEGDSIDAAPRWSAKGGERLVYQSAGVGRDERGLYGGRGSFQILALDFDKGEVDQLAAEEGFDLLVPREAADGALYYIRRPFDPNPKTASAKDVAVDMAMIPVRLGRAVLGYLDLFTATYSGKPLRTSSGAAGREAPDQKWMTLMGNVIDVEQARLESLKAGDETPALVPQDWELIRQAPSGSVEVVASAVVAFDLCADGSLLYTNGRAIFHMTGSKARKVAEAELVTAVLSRT